MFRPAAGTHNGTELNTGFTLRFDLVTTPTGNYTKVPGNTVTITPVILPLMPPPGAGGLAGSTSQ